MPEHLSTRSIERYRRLLMSPTELLAADDHLAACAACRELAAGGGALPAAFTALHEELETAGGEAPEHFSYAQLTAYVEHEMGEVEREVAASHLEFCAECAEEVRDLLAFRATIPSTAAQSTLANPSTPRGRPAPFRWLAALLTPRRLGAVAALALLIFATWWLLTSRRRADEHGSNEVARSTPTPVALPRATPAVGTEPRAGGTAPSGTPGAGQDNVAPRDIPQPGPPPAPVSGAGPEIVVELDDAGRRVTLDSRGHVAGLGALDPSSARAVRAALQTGRAPVPASLSELVGRRGTTLGGSTPDAAFSLSSPVGNVVRSDRPTMRWRPLEGAASYVVIISDANLNTLLTSPPLTGTEWSVPRSLPRGGVYTWQVTALKGGAEIVAPVAPEPEARFRVLEQARLEELSDAERSHPDAHLALGVLYARAGLLDDAERELQALAEKNPGSPVARKLLRSVRRRRQPQE